MVPFNANLRGKYDGSGPNYHSSKILKLIEKQENQFYYIKSCVYKPQ